MTSGSAGPEPREDAQPAKMTPATPNVRTVRHTIACISSSGVALGVTAAGTTTGRVGRPRDLVVVGRRRTHQILHEIIPPAPNEIRLVQPMGAVRRDDQIERTVRLD